MFASNQVFELSGNLSDLELVLKFVIKFYNANTESIGYQITDDGKYCLGWSTDEKDGWHKFPFDYDVHIISEIIKQHINKQPRENTMYDWADGGTSIGFLMKAIPELFSDEYEGIKHPFYGIVSIERFENFYSK